MPYSRQEVQTKINNILILQLGLPPNTPMEAAPHLTDDLGADSLDYVELVMAIETEFDISIPDEEATKISTVGDILAYLEEALAH
jgi:acyl carrier protein